MDKSKEIQLSEERLRIIFETSPIGIAIISLETNKRLYINPAMVELFGASSVKQLLENDLKTTYADPADLDRMRSKVGDEFITEIEVERKRLDGTKWWCLLNRRLIDYGGRPALIGWHYDITERKQAEAEIKRLNEELEQRVEERTKELRKSEALFRAVVNYSPTKIHIKDVEGRYTLINKEAEKVFGVTDEEGRGKTTYDLFEKDVADAFTAHDQEVIESGEAIEEEEDFTLDDGVHTYLTTKFPIFDQDRITGIGAIGTDITERKQAEDALRQSEERYRTLVESANVIAWELDLKTWCFTFVSPHAVDLIGYALNEWYEEGFWVDHIHPDDREQSVLLCTRATERGEDHDFEYRMIAADGRSVWLRDIVTVVKEDGRPVSLRGFMIDITEHKRAEEARLEAESRFRAVVDASPAPITLKDRDGRYILVNKAFGAWMKTDVAKITGQTIFDFLSKAQAEDVQEKDRHLLETGKLDVEEATRSFQDGFERTVLISRCPVLSSDGDVNGIVTILTDITERKQAEEALSESENLLNSIIKNVPVGLLIKDLDHIVERANDTYLSWYGFDADTMGGRRSDEIENFQSAEEAEFMNAQEREVLTTGQTQTRQVDRLFADGQIHTLAITKFPVYDQQGNITKVGSVSIDLTEQVQAQKVADVALQEAETANRAKSEFLASVSHELRTPLTAILGFAEIMSQQYFGPIEDKYKEYAEDIQSSGKHLLTLVNEILDLSALEAGKQPLVKENLSTMEIVGECTRILEEKARSGGINLVTKIPKDIPPLYADRRASIQILLNLLSNAVKFTAEGGKVTVSAKGSKRNMTLKIADTGKGIPADKLPKLTDPFTRTDADPYLAEQGWGLGLSITKALVDLHDGTLDIKSKVGKGTTVTVIFPNRT